MGRTSPPNPFIPIKPDKVEFDELNTWEKFYKDDKIKNTLMEKFKKYIKKESKYPVLDYLCGIPKLRVGGFARRKTECGHGPH